MVTVTFPLVGVTAETRRTACRATMTMTFLCSRLVLGLVAGQVQVPSGFTVGVVVKHT